MSRGWCTCPSRSIAGKPIGPTAGTRSGSPTWCSGWCRARTWRRAREIVEVPVTQRRLVPETHISKVPETVRWTEQEEITTKVAIDPPAGRDASSIASRPDVGGKKLESDPPRTGTIIKRY